MNIGTHKRTREVTVLLTQDEAEKLAMLLNTISTHTPHPEDDPSTALYRILREVLDV